jgi:hypothetical protein
MKWEQMTLNQRLEYLAERANRHKIFSKSQPKFDAEFFQRCSKIAESETLRDLMNDMHTYFEANPESERRYKNFREHYRKLLLRRVKAMRYQEAKKTKKIKEAGRPKRRTCADCGRVYGVDFHILYGVQCQDCYTKS